MADTDRIVLVTGATGAQGGSLIRALDGKGFKLRGMTRKPQGDPARALAEKGIQIVPGDLDDERSLAAAMDGVWGIFSLQNTWEAGVQAEEEQGKRLARVARERGVQHFVYSSVGSAQRGTGIPHFENKWRIEEVVRQLAFPSHVIFRPVFFMENLLSPWFLNGDKIVSALKPETSLQMIAVEDIGRFIARGFTHAAEMNRREIDLAGDSKTMPQTVEILAGAMGKKLEYLRIPIEEVQKNSEDFALMLEWFDRVGYDADVPALEREFGFKPLTLEKWAKGKVRA